MTIFPSYYKKFKCRASECKNNCCIGWEIDIDGEALKKYQSLDSELGEKIRRNIKTEGGTTFFSMGEGCRCPMLDRNNLCEIISALGDEGLCEICREHPRFYFELSGVTLGGVGMSCEAAAELILCENEPTLYGDILPLLDTEDEDYGCASIICEALFDVENILQSKTHSEREKIEKALLAIKAAEEKISNLIYGIEEAEEASLANSGASAVNSDARGVNSGARAVNSGAETVNICASEANNSARAGNTLPAFEEPPRVQTLRKIIPELEFMKGELPEELGAARWADAFECWSKSKVFRKAILNATGYFAARYLPKALGGEFSPYEFISSSLIILALLFAKKGGFLANEDESKKIPEEAIRAAVLYSEEIEYCEENVERLSEMI